MFIDFNEVKTRVSILDAAKFLGLKVWVDNGKHRCPCPRCNQGGERAIVFDTTKNMFFDFVDKKGGDVISLVMHQKQITARQAAELLYEQFINKPQEEPPTDGLQPIKNLEHVHPAVQQLNMSEEEAAALGVGYCTKGMMRGLVAIPIRAPSGALVGYIGLKGEVKVPPKWRMP
jgi:DNA primase